MQPRRFTLAEARAALPTVKQHMEVIQAERRAILELRPEAWPALQKAALNGGNPAAGRLLDHFHRLEHHVKAILAMGVLVKDIDLGLVDFLARRQGQDVFLCWRYGEDDLRYWHPLDAGYAGRRPIVDSEFA